MLNYLKRYVLVRNNLFFKRHDSGKALASIFDDNNAKINSQLTSLDIINHEPQKTYFRSYSVNGFTLSSNLRIIGSCIALPKTILFWNVNTIEDVNEESLEIINVLEPKIDILIFGKGHRNAKPNFKFLFNFCKERKINLELLPTAEALSTFNFLNYEERNVAACLLPAQNFNYHAEDQVEIMELRRKRVEMFTEKDIDLLADSEYMTLETMFDPTAFKKRFLDRVSSKVEGIVEDSKLSKPQEKLVGDDKADKKYIK